MIFCPLTFRMTSRTLSLPSAGSPFSTLSTSTIGFTSYPSSFNATAVAASCEDTIWIADSVSDCSAVSSSPYTAS